jgi:hypothetical protein
MAEPAGKAPSSPSNGSRPATKTFHVVGVGSAGMLETAAARKHIRQQLELTYGAGSAVDGETAQSALPENVYQLYLVPGGEERMDDAVRLFERHRLKVSELNKTIIRNAFKPASTTYGVTLEHVSIVVYDKAAKFGAVGVANLAAHEAGHALSELPLGKDHEFGGIMSATPSGLQQAQDWPEKFVASLRAGN